MVNELLHVVNEDQVRSWKSTNFFFVHKFVYIFVYQANEDAGQRRSEWSTKIRPTKIRPNEDAGQRRSTWSTKIRQRRCWSTKINMVNEDQTNEDQTNEDQATKFVWRTASSLDELKNPKFGQNLINTQIQISSCSDTNCRSGFWSPSRIDPSQTLGVRNPLSICFDEVYQATQ